MTYDIDLDKPFEIRTYLEFLDKKRVLEGCEVKIEDIKAGINENRPQFVGNFPFGLFKFDICVAELHKITSVYGKVPRNWIGKTLFIKAKPYSDGKSRGLQLIVTPK